MSKTKNFFLLHFAVFIYSLVSVFSKLTSSVLSEQGLFSFEFISMVSLMILSLGVYAIIWQIVLKKTQLSVAYANKGATLIWSLIWSIFIFNESISIFNVLGIVFVILGIVVIAKYE